MSLAVERAGDGPDLVLLHGWGLNSAVWAELVPVLARRYRVHAIDLPGHGASVAAPFGSLEAVSAQVAALVPAGARLLGWSLGGLIAQRIALDRPGHLAKLLLACTSPCFMQREGWPHAIDPEVLQQFADGLRDDPQGTMQAFLLLNALGSPQARSQVRAITARLAQQPVPAPAALAASLEVLRATDLRPEIAGIALPTFVLAARLDKLTPIAAGRWLADRIPGARGTFLDDAAHLPFISHRDAFVAAMEAFDG